MFENYDTMSDAEKADVKAIHRAMRTVTGTRYGNLAWGFVRGFPYRRIERKTQTQELGDGSVYVHNRPSAIDLTNAIARFIPTFAAFDPKKTWATKANADVEAWLKSEEGAIPAPVRTKKPYIRRSEEAAQ